MQITAKLVKSLNIQKMKTKVSYPKNQINDDLVTGIDDLRPNTDGETGDEVQLRLQGLQVQSVKIPIDEEEINDGINVEIVMIAVNAMITNGVLGIETMIDPIEITRGLIEEIRIGLIEIRIDLIEIRIGLIVNQVTTILGNFSHIFLEYSDRINARIFQVPLL